MLKPLRQQAALNLDFCTPDTSERGGLLHHTTVSGIDVVQYVANPSGFVPVGFQFNDVEYIDYSRQVDPRRNREVDDPWSIVGIFTRGEVETDWVHTIGELLPGAPAYAGPSGTVTNSSSFGGAQIGYFTSALRPNLHLVVYRGKGFTTSYQDCVTKRVVVDNDPNDRILVLSEGYVRVRIDQRYIDRHVAGLTN